MYSALGMGSRRWGKGLHPGQKLSRVAMTAVLTFALACAPQFWWLPPSMYMYCIQCTCTCMLIATTLSCAGLMGLLEKRRFQKFLIFCNDYEESDPKTHQGAPAVQCNTHLHVQYMYTCITLLHVDITVYYTVTLCNSNWRLLATSQKTCLQ